jgi:hypothetical protein
MADRKQHARPRRSRPTIATTLSPAVAEEARRRAAVAQVPVARVMDAALRFAFDMPPEVPIGPVADR